MPLGTVKWFNNAKGYGFILSSDGVSDVFAHYSAINMEGYKTLKAGQEVSFELAEGQKGLHASNIMPVINNTEVTATRTEPDEHFENGNN